jgi:hypothetical protein
MLRPNQPTADAALLVYLLSVLSLFLGFALFMHWLMQPTVLPNAGLAGFETQQQRAVVLLASKSPVLDLQLDIQRAELAFALQENERQGLEPFALASAGPELAPPPLAKTAPTAPKAKRVVRVQRQPSEPAYASNAWGRVGGFGGWFR